MAAAPKYFSKPDRIVTHRISASPSMVTPSNTRRAVSGNKPAPLIVNTGCASCRKRRGM